MGIYTGQTAKYTRSKGFDAATLAAIRDAKAQHKQSRPAEPTPPNLYNIGDKFYLANGAWKLKRVVGGYLTLEELDALGRAIRKTKKRSARIIEITEGAFMEHIKRDKDFLASVDAAAQQHQDDCEDAYRELMCASRFNGHYSYTMIVPGGQLAKLVEELRACGVLAVFGRWQGTLAYIRIRTTWENLWPLQRMLEMAKAA